VVKNPSARHKDVVFAEFPTIKMARTREWKLVRYNGDRYGELYHLAEDPYELTNLWGDRKYADPRAKMERVLGEWLKQ
jgi:arylsulfatase A-like enzyme